MRTCPTFSSLIPERLLIFELNDINCIIFQTKLRTEIKQILFNQIIIRGTDRSHRHWNKIEVKNLTINWFDIKSDTCIEITVFYNRNEFLWIGKSGENLVKMC